MSIFSFADGFFSSVLGKKAFAYNTKAMLNKIRDTSHPENYKARDGLEANKDVQAFRTNNDLVASYGKAIESGVVGTGFTLQYKSPDRELNKKVEAFLSYWSEDENCEVTGRFFRQDLERFMAVEASIVGGFIIRHHWDKKLNTLYSPEILSTTNIDRTKNDFAKGLFFGVQVDKLGRISGIHIYDNATRMNSTFNSMKNLTLFVDVWSDPHQYTNVSPVAPILNTLDKLASYTDSEVTGAEKRANKSIIVATPMYNILVEAQMQAIKNAETEADKELAQEEYMKLISEFSGIGIHDGATPIAPSADTQVWDLKQSGDTIYADISLNSKQILSKALGLSASTVAGIPESSYNQALKTSQQDEGRYAIIAQKIVEKVCKKMYRNAIEAGYLLGFYDLSDYYTNKMLYNSYLKIGRRQLGHIDPLKQNSSDVVAVKAGFSSHTEIASTRGKDIEEVIDDQVNFELMKKQKFEEAGLKYIQTDMEKLELELIKQEDSSEDEDDSKKPTKEEE